MPEQDSKPSWADQMEEGEGGAPPSSTTTSSSTPAYIHLPDVALPPMTEVLDGDTKIITEHKVNKDGKRVKLVLHYNVERRQVSKSIAKRKIWKKFGAADKDPPGPNPSNTIVSEEIFMQFFTTKEDEQNRADDDVLNKLKGQKLVKCRICKEEHWTTQCPYKDRLGALPDLVKEEAKPATPSGAGGAQSDDKLKAGKYVPPSMRDGANRRGDAMPSSKSREELPTIRVTNLSEEVRDSDLQELFRPFGSISRVYLGKDKLTGQSKGFAFISFIRREDAARAIQGVNGYGYDNLILSVEWAKPSGNS